MTTNIDHVDSWENQYLGLMNTIINQPNKQKNRTGIDTWMIPGAMMNIDLSKGFPAVTTKKLFFDAVKGELLGFLRGYTSAAQFRELGCKIWDQNANENKAWLENPWREGEDDLGYIYSRLWTDMPVGEDSLFAHARNKMSYTGPKTWNQIEKLIEAIGKDPTSRRLIVSAWHPEVFDQAALPPCHVLFQVLIEQATNKMHMTMYQRSCDMFLGVPFNVASYALLTHILCAATGYEPGTLTWFGADCHVYENHLGQVVEQLGRDVKPMPKLGLPEGFYLSDGGYEDILALEPKDIHLVEYEHHPALKAPMAV